MQCTRRRIFASIKSTAKKTCTIVIDLSNRENRFIIYLSNRSNRSSRRQRITQEVLWDDWCLISIVMHHSTWKVLWTNDNERQRTTTTKNDDSVQLSILIIQLSPLQTIIPRYYYRLQHNNSPAYMCVFRSDHFFIAMFHTVVSLIVSKKRWWL